MISGIPVLFFALALIEERHDNALFERLFTAANEIEKLHGSDRFAAVLRILADFVRVAGGEIKLKQSPWLTLETVANKPWVDLFQGLALYWLDERPGDRQIRRLSRHVDKAMKNGLDWYVGEATALLEVLGVDTGEIDYLCEDDPRQRLVSLYRAKPRWQENLAALNLITQRHADGGKEGRAQAAHNRRMVWWIHGEGGFVTLEPREQKRNKQGTWTKGRKVALKRLDEEPETFDYLTAEDLKICAAIRKEYERNYSYYVEISYELEGEAALRAAIGHPHLYRGDMDGRDNQTVTLEDASPWLEGVEDRRERPSESGCTPIRITDWISCVIFSVTGPIDTVCR